MRRTSRPSRLVASASLFVALLAGLLPPPAGAHGSGAAVRVSPAAIAAAGFAIQGSLPAPEDGAVELKFRDIYRMPVGPRGLEMSAKVLALNGKKVRMVGYMVERESPTPGSFILSPLPATIGDDDESLADDLPPSVVFVELETAAAHELAFMPGLLHFTGTLRIGSHEQPDGRVAGLRLQLDATTSAALQRVSDSAFAVAAH